MKRKELNKTQETGSSQKEKLPENTVKPAEKEIVIPDECGDSLWDAILAQDTMKALLAQSSDEKKNQSIDGKTPESNKS